VSAERAIGCMHNTKTEPRVLTDPAEQKLAGDRLSETARAWYELAHRLDGPNDRQSRRACGRSARALLTAHASQKSQRDARWHNPECNSNRDDKWERGQ